MRWKGRRVSTNVEDRRGGVEPKRAVSVFWAWWWPLWHGSFLESILNRLIKPPSKSPHMHKVLKPKV